MGNHPSLFRSISERIDLIKAEEEIKIDAANKEALTLEKESIKMLKKQAYIPKFDKILIKKSVQLRND